MTTVVFSNSKATSDLLSSKPQEASPNPPHQSKETMLSRGKGSPPSTQSINQKQRIEYRLLSQDEWVLFCRGVGVSFKDTESLEILTPKSWIGSLKGLPGGLYQDIFWEKCKFDRMFQILAIIKWILTILQLAISTTITALGTVWPAQGTAITVFAATNTIIAGVLAVMHNSGLPDRYRLNRAEFANVEAYVKAVIYTRVVLAEESIAEVLASCYGMFVEAQRLVQNNCPVPYVAATHPASSKVVTNSPRANTQL